MTKRVWVILGAIFLAGVILAGVAAGVFLLQRQRQHAEWRRAGFEFYQEQDFLQARNMLGLYLKNHPEDLEALETYVESVLNTAVSRRDNLARGATGLNQMLRYIPEDDPKHDEVVDELIEVYTETEAWGDLQFFCEQQLQSDPDDTELKYYIGFALYEQGQIDRAEAIFTELAEAGAEEPRVYSLLASILSDRRLPTRAEEALARGLEVMPDSPAMRVERAQYLWAQRETDRALDEVNAALELDANYVDALVTKASFLNAERQFDEAIELAERALEIEPQHGLGRSVLGFAYRRTGRVDDAIELLQNTDRLVKVDNPNLLLALAELLYSAERVEEAQATADMYLESYPSHVAIRDYFEGRHALIEEDYERAIDKLTLVYNEQPTFSPAQFFLAVAYLEAGQRQQARNTLEIYVRNHPDDESARALMAREFSDTADPATLREMATGVLANINADPETLVQAALPMFNSAVMQGEARQAAELAARLFEKALELDPQHSEAYAGLADVYAAIGDLDKAQASLQRGLDAGVPSSGLALSRANIAVRTNELGKVREIMREELSDSETNIDEALRWTSFLVTRNLHDLALEAVNQVEPAIAEESKTALRIERGRILARAGALDEAQALLSEIEGQVSGDEQLREAWAGARLELAQMYLQAGGPDDLARAREIVEPYQDGAGDNAFADLLYADILARMSPPRFAEARELLENLLEREPENIRALLAAASIAKAQGDMDAAKSYAESAVKQAPTFIPGHVQLASILLDMNEVALARVGLERAQELAPDDFDVLRLLAQAYLREGARQPADRTLQRLENAAVGNPERERMAASLRSEYMRMSGDTDEAVALLREQYSRAPDDLELARSLSEGLLRQNNPEAAAEIMEDYVDRHADAVGAWIGLARVYAAWGGEERLERAHTALTRALILDPRNLDALREMAGTLMAQRNYTDALAVADRLLTIRPNDDQMLFQKAMMLTRDPAMLPNALELVNRAIEQDDDPQYRSLRGFIYLSQENYGDALLDLEAAARGQRETTAQFDLALAEAYAGTGDDNRAQRYLKSAREKAGADGELDAERVARIEALLANEEQDA